MTSDAKIGLLLGLVFIFIIAFIINGLPSFHKDKNNNELTTNMVSSQNKTGIGAYERKVINQETVSPTATAERHLPEINNPFASKEPTIASVQVPATVPAANEPDKTIGTSADIQASAAIAAAQPATAAPVEPAAQQTYVVAGGDTLARIAKKFYGEQEGGKRANILAIYQANRKILKSADSLQIGQKLVIPQVPNTGSSGKSTAGVFDSPMFTKVKAMGERNSSASTGGQKQSVQSQSKQTGQYVVKEGDNLWKIAAEKLGDGNRYREIAKLNSDALSNEDNLEVGMSLKLPTR